MTKFSALSMIMAVFVVTAGWWAHLRRGESPRGHNASSATATALVPCRDWPSWGGSDPGRNMVSPETGLVAKFKPGEKSPSGDGILPTTTKNVRWAVKLGNYICGNPTVVDGRVFVGTDDSVLKTASEHRFKHSVGGMVWCLDEKTGHMLWRLPVPRRLADRLPENADYTRQMVGVCSSPTVVGNRAYLMSSAAEILCLDVKGQSDGNDGPFMDEAHYMSTDQNAPVPVEKTDGDIIWKYDLVNDLGICPHDMAACSVLVDGRFLYSVSANGVNHDHTFCLRPNAPSFIVLDTLTGKLLAEDNEDLGHRLFHCLWSSPSSGVVNGKKLIFFGGGDGVCYAFEALTEVPEKPVYLKKVWSYDCNPPSYRHPEGEDEFNYKAGNKWEKYATNTDDGSFVGPSEIIGTPVFHDGRVYCTLGQDPTHGRGRGLLQCIDASKTGDITQSGCVWTYDGIERSLSSVAISNGLLYATDLAGHVHCLDEKTGKPYWVYDTHAETWATPLVADGKVYVNTKSKLFIFEAGKEMKMLSRISLGAACYSTPVVANGTLFVASQSYLWAVQNGAHMEGEPLPAVAATNSH